jgi:hypothetical protein
MGLDVGRNIMKPSVPRSVPRIHASGGSPKSSGARAEVEAGLATFEASVSQPQT